MKHAFYKTISLILIFLILAGCGGIVDEALDESIDSLSIGKPRQAIFGPVKICEVRNLSGKSKYDDLCHYIHIKTAQLLTDSLGVDVVSDELLNEVAGSLDLDLTGETPASIVDVDLFEVDERSGGTITIAIFSSQEKRALAKCKIHIRSIDSGIIRSGEGMGRSSKGAWGVVAKVNRESMVSQKGIWKLDNSMLGIACIRALKSAVAEL